MRNAKLPLFAVPVLRLLLVSFVVIMLASFVQCRQVPYSPEVELGDPKYTATANALGVMSMRRLQTVRPAPLGYPPAPTVAEPPASPSPSPSVT